MLTVLNKMIHKPPKSITIDFELAFIRACRDIFEHTFKNAA